jgi:hypothetical protein
MRVCSSLNMYSKKDKKTLSRDPIFFGYIVNELQEHKVQPLGPQQRGGVRK